MRSKIVIPLLLHFLVVLCSNDPPPDRNDIFLRSTLLVPGAATAELMYYAESYLVDASPNEVWTAVTVVNPTREQIQIEFGSCSMWIYAYSNLGRSGTPVWGSSGYRYARPSDSIAAVCPDYLGIRVLAPGDSVQPEEFRTRFPVAEILGDSLPEGHYYFAAAVEVNGDTVRLPAGEARLTMNSRNATPLGLSDELSYRAKIQILTTSSQCVRGDVQVINTGDREVLLEYGKNAVWLRVDSITTPSSSSVWEETRWLGRNPEITATQLPPGQLQWRLLASGDSFAPSEFKKVIPLPEILGDSLPEGPYNFFMMLYLRGDTVRVPAGMEMLRWTSSHDPASGEDRRLVFCESRSAR